MVNASKKYKVSKKYSKKAGSLFAVPDTKRFAGKTYERDTYNMGTMAKAKQQAREFRKQGHNARVVKGTLQNGDTGYFVYTKRKR